MTLVTGADGRRAVPIGSVLMPQSGALIGMRTSAVDACPDELLADPTNPPELWHLASPTLSTAARSIGRR